MAATLVVREVYSDVYTNFDVHPISNNLLRKTNEDAVKQSIRNIILTDNGERLFDPEFGGNVRALLFENIIEETFDLAEEIIRDAIINHEPRAELIDVNVGPTSDDNGIFIKIIFKVINIEDPIVLEVVLDRIR